MLSMHRKRTFPNHHLLERRLRARTTGGASAQTTTAGCGRECVGVSVCVGLGVDVAVAVAVGCAVGVNVGVRVGVGLGVKVAVEPGGGVAVGVGGTMGSRRVVSMTDSRRETGRWIAPAISSCNLTTSL